MLKFRNIRNVRRLPEAPPAYLCVLEVEVHGAWETMEYCARPGGGGICDAVVAEIEAGNYEGEIVPWEPGPEPVPQSISAVQFRVQASRAGILDQIEAIIADPQTPAEVKIAWEHAREFERASPTIEALRQHPSIDLTAEEVDDLFREAAQITV